MVTYVWVLLLVGVFITCGAFYIYWLSKQTNRLKTLADKRTKELEYLQRITDDALLSQKTIEERFSNYLDDLKDTFGWKYDSIFKLDEEKQVVRIRFTGGLPEWYMKELGQQWLIRVGDASIGRAIATKQPCAVNIAEVDPRFRNVSSYGVRAEYHSLACYPMIGKLKIHGGYCTYGEFHNMFSLHDIKFLLTCGNLYALLLEDQLLHHAPLASNQSTV